MRRYQASGTGEVSLQSEFLRLMMVVLDGTTDTASLMSLLVCFIKLQDEVVLLMVGIHIQATPAL